MGNKYRPRNSGSTLHLGR